MRFRIEFDGRARQDFARLDGSIRRRIMDKLDWYEAHPEGLFPAPLHGEWRDFDKLRVGDWRLMYKFDSVRGVLTIHYVEHRGRAYKKHLGK